MDLIQEKNQPLLNETGGIKILRGPDLDNLYQMKLSEKPYNKLGSEAKQILNSYSLDNGIWKNPNFYILNFLKLVLPDEKRVADFEDMSFLFNKNPNYVKGDFIDFAEIILRSNYDDSSKSHDNLAKSLVKQVRNKGFKCPTPESPLKLGYLQIEKNKKMPYGLGLKLTQNSTIKVVPGFAYSNNKKKFSEISRDGPVFKEKGDKVFYAKDKGVSGIHIDPLLNIVTNSGELCQPTRENKVFIIDKTKCLEELLDAISTFSSLLNSKSPGSYLH